MKVNAGLQPALAVAKSSTLLPVTPVLGLVIAVLVVAAAAVKSAGSLDSLFSFSKAKAAKLKLNPDTGAKG